MCVARRFVNPSAESGPLPDLVIWKRGVRISSWPGCNGSSLARGRIHLSRLSSLDRLRSCTGGADHTFRRMASWSISRSSDRSATIFLSFEFSPRAAPAAASPAGRRPSYLFFQLKYVAWLMPAFRQISATGTPSAPCFRMNAFCASVNFDAFVEHALPSPGKHARKLYLRSIQFPGSRPYATNGGFKVTRRTEAILWPLGPEARRLNHEAPVAFYKLI
jgi:hypothetical protein